MLGADGIGRLDVLPGHDEHMDRHGGLDVAEGVGPLGRGHFLGRQLAGHDAAEDAIVCDGGQATGMTDGAGDLERWAADARAREAADARVRERWLRAQAAEDASLAGVFLALAERRETV